MELARLYKYTVFLTIVAPFIFTQKQILISCQAPVSSKDIKHVLHLSDFL